MASGGDIKGFYRQRKKNTTISGGVTKPSAAASKKKGTVAAKGPSAASVGSGGDPQPPALISHGSLDVDKEYGPEEEVLRLFDMDMKYGPCLGVTRLERWERAARLGLHPPAELEGLLLRHREAGGGGAPAVKLECLWEGRI
ncbi:hypothetical protein Taro_037604 [Colocasia esculenta]|uniref:DNA polymerase delta subunit 4 n=1 Tax=Colocasia esculenta TaxID=4460 RepID=A0A843WQ72_COLES|nr:hypothetical protein [Colocasia esculenta]